MSILSYLQRSRQSAKHHNAKLAEQKKKEEVHKPPYKHVPTHAATDALASGPPAWREIDRERIVEQNRRRSAMLRRSHRASMPTTSRVGSSLSHVSFPNDDASPLVRTPRTFSYTGLSSLPHMPEHIGEGACDSADDLPTPIPGNKKGKGIALTGSAYDTSSDSSCAGAT